ncbi:MAG: hypothetical protein R2737_02055 [Candidatus Nanopelagicales bacterium]
MLTDDVAAWVDAQLATAPPLAEGTAERLSVALFGSGGGRRG